MTGAHVIQHCRTLARFSEEPGYTTRTFLSPPMHDVHAYLRSWMERIGMRTTVDAMGNLRGLYPARTPDAPRLLLGSHLDTVPRAGAFDGVLGVVMAIALVKMLAGARLSYAIEVIGFSEEEGVRFGVPFLGSRAVVGTVDDQLLSCRDRKGHTVADAVQAFGLNPEDIPLAKLTGSILGYVEFHIEQGPVLESLGLPIAIVDAIAGQNRLMIWFEGAANHAGTTPMAFRRDALAAAAEWMVEVEQTAKTTDGLVATVGQIHVEPGATNVIPRVVQLSLDIRHATDSVRTEAVQHLLSFATGIAARRHLSVHDEVRLNQAAVPLDSTLTDALASAAARVGLMAPRLVSGAGHDAMILAPTIASAMLFVRSPGGLSHHPDESVIPEDITAALAVGLQFLRDFDA